MYFNSQRQEAISPIYPRSSQRCRGLSAGNKEIREVMQSLTLPAYHMSSSSSSLSPTPTKSCHKEHPIWGTFLVTTWSTTKFVKKNLFFYAKKCTWSTTLLTLTNGHVSQLLWASPKGCAGVQVCRCAGALRSRKSVRTIHFIDILNRAGACVMTEIELFDHNSKRRDELQRNEIGPQHHSILFAATFPKKRGNLFCLWMYLSS